MSVAIEANVTINNLASSLRSDSPMIKDVLLIIIEVHGSQVFIEQFNHR